MKIVFILLITIIVSSCGNKLNIKDSKLITNTKQNLEKPYVLLLSLDGFRWDYVERFNPPNLKQFIASGVRANSLIPTFPSKTFSNHYTIATGMYPDNHGIIDNSFYNPKLDKKYAIRDRDAVEDGRFYGGLPLWVNAAQSGMVSASYFFVGTEAEIQGFRPSYYYLFDSKVEKSTQVNQLNEWLQLPEKTRPHFISMYFKDVDVAGHDYGPSDSPKVREAVMSVDKALGDIMKVIKHSKLDVNVVIVSDHGMRDIKLNQFISFDDYVNADMYTIVVNGVLANIHPKKGNSQKQVFEHLQKLTKDKPIEVMLTQDVPYFDKQQQNPNWGSIQLVPDDGHYFISKNSLIRRKESGQELYGAHGFDANNKTMHGIFYANGSAFKNNHQISSIKNIHIYPLICEILGLTVPDFVDGKLMEIRDVLK